MDRVTERKSERERAKREAVSEGVSMVKERERVRESESARERETGNHRSTQHNIVLRADFGVLEHSRNGDEREAYLPGN